MMIWNYLVIDVRQILLFASLKQTMSVEVMRNKLLICNKNNVLN